MTRLKIIFAIFASIVAPLHASAQPSCEFKGISVGDKLSKAEIMSALGIKSYKTDPKIDLTNEHRDLVDRYGYMNASEINDFNIGPYCKDNGCMIPFGVTLGIDNFPATVWVGTKRDTVTAIDISFNASSWDQVKDITRLKYGENRQSEFSSIVISNYSSKSSVSLTNELISYQQDGVNTKTNDHCKIWLVRYDSFFEHGDPLGVYHSTIAIEMISKDL